MPKHHHTKFYSVISPWPKKGQSEIWFCKIELNEDSRKWKYPISVKYISLHWTCAGLAHALDNRWTFARHALEVFWICVGHAWHMRRSCTGRVLEMRWTCVAYALVMHWTCSGYALTCVAYALVKHRTCSGYALDMRGICAGHALDVLWICAVMFEPSWMFSRQRACSIYLVEWEALRAAVACVE